MENRNLIIIIIIAVIAVVVGIVLGMSLQSKMDAPKISNGQTYETAVKSLSSKVIPSIIAYGQVSKIEGRNITLSYNNEALTIAIAENANIYSFEAPASGSKTTQPTQKKVAFAEIKKGDSLNITVKLSADGKISGQSVIILMKGK